MASELWQSVEQRFRVLQILRLEALRKPAVHRLEEDTRLLRPALPMPQPGETRRGAEFEELGILSTRNLERPSKQSFGFRPSTQQDLALEAMQFGVPVGLSESLRCRQCAVDEAIRP